MDMEEGGQGGEGASGESLVQEIEVEIEIVTRDRHLDGQHRSARFPFFPDKYQALTTILPLLPGKRVPTSSGHMHGVLPYGNCGTCQLPVVFCQRTNARPHVAGRNTSQRGTNPKVPIRVVGTAWR